MDAKNLYYLHYKQGVQSVKQSLIVATSGSKAEEVGHAFCDRVVNRRFIRVEPAIVADESILVAPDGAAPPEPQDTPNNGLDLKALQEDSGGLVGAGVKTKK
jgi:hypothetical protein